MNTDREDYLALDDARLLAQCQVHTYRASGPGGQKRNKTSSAVRLHHRPTGLIAKSTESRLQHVMPNGRLQCGRRDARYPSVVRHLLDIFFAYEGRTADTAAALGITTAHLVSFFRKDPKLWARVNEIRARFGTAPLR